VRTIRYVSPLGGGYGQAAVAYVRGLVNAGVRVQWTPFLWPRVDQPIELLSGDAILDALAARPHGLDSTPGSPDEDIAALVRATSRRDSVDSMVIHTPPEQINAVRMGGVRTIANTVWETDRLPAHWVPLLGSVDAVCVPSTMNADVFARSGVRAPLSVVPHIRRTRWSEIHLDQIGELRASLGLRSDCVTFYSINTWDIRKNTEGLLRGFAQAFHADEPVQLIVKTESRGFEARYPFRVRACDEMAVEILSNVNAELGRKLPPVCIWAGSDLPASSIDALHEMGDCFVSATHGEGWGLGAFEAASYGNPVVMTAWGGQRDFLPPGWRGAIDCELTAATVWPTRRPSYWSDQRWAAVSTEAIASALRSAYNELESRRAEALGIQADIAARFSGSRITAMLMKVIYG
jgi:glycosyltransferase involved in cell wall biosynthesis